MHPTRWGTKLLQNNRIRLDGVGDKKGGIHANHSTVARDDAVRVSGSGSTPKCHGSGTLTLPLLKIHVRYLNVEQYGRNSCLSIRGKKSLRTRSLGGTLYGSSPIRTTRPSFSHDVRPWEKKILIALSNLLHNFWIYVFFCYNGKRKTGKNRLRRWMQRERANNW